MTKIIELRPDKRLLNTNFQKYQFSAGTSPVIFERSLNHDVLRIEPNSTQDSWLEARLFAFHNHLFRNHFDNTCWFIDDTRGVWRLKINGTLDLIYTLKAVDENHAIPLYNPSIGFASENIIIISNGSNTLDVLFIESMGTAKPIELYKVDAGVLLDVEYVVDTSTIIIALCNILDFEGKKCSNLNILWYLCEYKDNCLENLKLTHKQVLRVKGVIDYVKVENNGNYLHIVSQDSAIFEYDSINPIDKEKTQHKNVSEIKIPKYCWSQDEDTLTVWIKVPQHIDKKLITVDITASSLSIKLKDTILIEGDTQYRLDPELTTWSRESDSLKVDLVKYESGQMWNELIKGDIGGECLPNETLAAEIHSRLAHLCTDQPEREGQSAIGFNAEQLEECDLQGRDNFLQRLDLKSHKVIHLAMLGTSNHILFTIKLKSSQILCLRHEHDACIWMPGEVENDHWRFKHIYTFPGFGYVEAGKTNKKFCVSPPAGTYVAIVEHTRHSFLYDRPENGSPVAKQQIVDLGPDTSPIMGAVATNKYLILLTKDKLYQLEIKF
ncbi:nudC domain-containing protein 1 [Cephus cinctus]|uniref:NudC domain-containing protein 1 n=1 Tax=Cephus cinctus TaxID=211228 RepID=A0AAJ7BJ52_CEPCN|nr:nudC domain-containing protein 1 [Cephus cinctus]